MNSSSDSRAKDLSNPVASEDSTDPPGPLRESWHRVVQASTRKKIMGSLGIAGFVLPALAYLLFVSRYSVNVVVFDQWSDVALIGKAFSGHLTVSDLWAQHNQNRILFPNLIVLVLAYSTHLNVRIEEILSAVLLVGSAVLIIWTHRRRSPTTPLVWYCPVTILLLSWVQYENTLWGFQLAWYVVVICAAGAFFVLDRKQMTGASLAIAMILSVVGSYSSIQGLLIWPAGLLLLCYRRVSWRLLVAWATAAVATAGLYFYNFHSSQLPPDQINPLLHPLFALKLFFFSLGNVAGKPIPIPFFPVATQKSFYLGPGNPWIVGLGIAIFVAAVFAVIRTGFGSARAGAQPAGIALIFFAFAFDALTVAGRGLHGYAGVSASRYTTFNMLALVGLYLVVISQPAVNRSDVGRTPFWSDLSSLRTTSPHAARKAYTLAGRALVVVVVGCVIAAAVPGYSSGLAGARQDHSVETLAASVLPKYTAKGGTKPLPGHTVDIYQEITGFMTQLIPVAKKDKLSLFDTK